MYNIIFVCEHGAAKSIIAATCFNRLAEQNGFDLHAIARGTDPDSALSEKAAAGLSADGLEPVEKIPRKLSITELESAQQIISFCELPAEYGTYINVDQWEDIPPVSEDYQKSRDAIVRHLEQLLDHIRRSS